MRFEPVMMHSPQDKSNRILFHPRLLSDFEIVTQIGWKMHAALDQELEKKSVVSKVRGSLGRALSGFWLKIIRKVGWPS